MPTLYFAMPDDALNDMTLSSGTDPAALNAALLSASVASPFTLSMNISYKVTVYSPNYFDIQVKSIETDLILLDSSGNEVGGASENASHLIGNSDVGFQNFARMANTTFSPNLIIKYSRVIPVNQGTTDPVLLHLYNVCVKSGNQDQRLRFRYRTVIDVKLISFTGFRPSTTGISSIKCPVGALPAYWNALSGIGI